MKRTCYTIHKWCGITVAALLLMQAVTGLALVFHWDLARLLDPQGMTRSVTTSQASLTQVDESLRAHFTQLAWHRLVFPKREDGTYLAQFADADGDLHYASVDPGNAAILRAGSIWSFPMEAAVHLHFNLMAGRLGMAVITLLAAAVCGLVVTGLIVWWPPKRYFARGFRIQWHAPVRRLVVDLHRVIGAIMAVFAFAIAFTGLLLAFEPLLADSASPPRLSHVPPANLISLDAAFANAQASFPGYEVHDIRRPNDSTLDVLFRAPEVGPRAVHFARIDRTSGAVTSVVRAGEQPNIAFYALPLHTGEQFGLAGQAIEVVCAVVLVLLLVTGIYMWLKRRAVQVRAAMERVHAT